MKIGMFDSGIGGINVLKEVMKKYPNQEYIYFGDTIHLPYGDKTKEQLMEFGTNIIRFFEEQQVDMIVIACGTCSGMVEEYQEKTDIPIYDIITPTVNYVKKNYRSVSLLATATTIEKGVFEKKLSNYGVQVYPLACPHFVPYLEGLNDQKLDMNRELQSLENKCYEAVILGCTHYPLLQKEIEQCLHVVSVDPGVCLADSIELKSESHFSLTIYMSELTSVLQSNVERILGYKVELIEKRLDYMITK